MILSPDSGRLHILSDSGPVLASSTIALTITSALESSVKISNRLAEGILALTEDKLLSEVLP